MLSEHKAPDAKAVLDFVCQLIQTVLKKSEHSLVVVDDDTARLHMLDAHLWVFEATSFIPHQLHLSPTSANTQANDSLSRTPQNEPFISADSISPVLLTNEYPSRFDGIILNLSPQAVPLSNQLAPERILEIITTDEVSIQHGRDKYKTYQQLGLSLNHFKL